MNQTPSIIVMGDALCRLSPEGRLFNKQISCKTCAVHDCQYNYVFICISNVSIRLDKLIVLLILISPFKHFMTSSHSQRRPLSTSKSFDIRFTVDFDFYIFILTACPTFISTSNVSGIVGVFSNMKKYNV